MKWEQVKIGELVTLKQGFAINKKTDHHMSTEQTALPLLRIADMRDKARKVFVKDTIPKGFIASNDDIIYTRTGQVGLVFTNQFGVVHNNCFKVSANDEKVLDRLFLFYVLKRDEFYTIANSLASGAAQQDLPHGAFNSIKIPLPPLPTQRRISEILSSYDDLIENNQKQIKLLEEAAMLLYKEWFVKLRFPGHENTKIVDGMPEGWRNCHLSEVAQVNATTIPRNYPHLNINYVDIGSVRAGNIDIRTEYTLANAPGRAKRIAMDGDIIWGMVRPNLKAYAIVLEPMPNDIFSTGFAVITAGNVPFSFLYCVVIQDAFVSYLVNCTNGAAYPAVKPIHFEDAKIIVPTDDLLTAFNGKTEPMYRRAHILRQQIDQAKNAWDKLLPKLMNGEIEV